MCVCGVPEYVHVDFKRRYQLSASFLLYLFDSGSDSEPKLDVLARLARKLQGFSYLPVSALQCISA